jgi:hypothetical protein
LHDALDDRPKDQVSVFVIPESVPWTRLWLDEARFRLKSLSSGSRFASLVFVAEPMTLWRLLEDDDALKWEDIPWMSLLQWSDGFLRHWLEERQIQLESEDRARLVDVTGLWPELIMEQVGERTELRVLKERISAVAQQGITSVDRGMLLRKRFGLDAPKPVEIIDALAQWCKPDSSGVSEPIEANDLATIANAPQDQVDLSLRWGELLGLTHCEGLGFWSVDPVVSRVLLGASG